MNRILVPTDFSENAANATEYALSLAKATGAEVILLHVYTPSVSRFNVISPLLAEETGRAKQIATERFNAIVLAAKSAYEEVHLTTEFFSGEVVRTILEVAEEKNVDFIVMGTKGASGIEKILFGSNTSAIIERAHCPVLAIPLTASYTIPKNILFATNFSYSDIESAMQLTSIAKLFGAKVVFTHVVTEEEALEPTKAVIEKFAREIELVTRYPKISYKIISDNSVNMGLDQMIEETHADILALATRRRSLFEKFYSPSLTKKFAYHSNVPLLAFHREDFSEDTGSDF